MSNQEIQYVKGFNSGYLLAKHMPVLLAKIIKNVSPANDFVEGLFSGNEEYELEYSRTQTEELKHLRNKSQNREKGFERD